MLLIDPDFLCVFKIDALMMYSISKDYFCITFCSGYMSNRELYTKVRNLCVWGSKQILRMAVFVIYQNMSLKQKRKR